MAERERFDLRTVRDRQTPLSTNGGASLHASFARQRLYAFHGERMFTRRWVGPRAPGRGWEMTCTLCGWIGHPTGCGRHARNAHGDRLLDLRTVGMVERYLVREPSDAPTPARGRDQ